MGRAQSLWKCRPNADHVFGENLSVVPVDITVAVNIGSISLGGGASDGPECNLETQPRVEKVNFPICVDVASTNAVSLNG